MMNVLDKGQEIIAVLMPFARIYLVHFHVHVIMVFMEMELLAQVSSLTQFFLIYLRPVIAARQGKNSGWHQHKFVYQPGTSLLTRSPGSSKLAPG